MAKNELLAVAKEVSVCTKCGLCRGRTKAVPGEGPVDASMVLVGEAPGGMEDKTGRPFVGPAGRMLDKALSEAGLSRKEVFITSVVKCRPPENREPEADEITACSRYLERQVDSIGPRVVVLLGRVARAAVTGRRDRIQRGPAGGYRGACLLTTYHPAVALHGRPQWFKALSQDLREAASLAAGSD
jgi:uracil-DNA glycosylase family 4